MPFLFFDLFKITADKRRTPAKITFFNKKMGKLPRFYPLFFDRTMCVNRLTFLGGIGMLIIRVFEEFCKNVSLYHIQFAKFYLPSCNYR